MREVKRADRARLEHVRVDGPVDETLAPSARVAPVTSASSSTVKSCSNSAASFEQLGRGAAELRVAPADDVSNPRWRRPVVDHTLGRPGAEQLGEQQRVAAGEIVESTDEMRARIDAHAFEELVDVVGREHRQRDAVRARRSLRTCCTRREMCGNAVSTLPRVLATTRTRFDTAMRPELADHVEQRLPGGLEIVDDEHDRRLGRERGDPRRRELLDVLVGYSAAGRSRPRPTPSTASRIAGMSGGISGNASMTRRSSSSVTVCSTSASTRASSRSGELKAPRGCTIITIVS